MAEDARRASDDASEDAVGVASDDSQGDSAIAVRRPGELERWLAAVETRLGDGS
jgi:hypothetical protein